MILPHVHADGGVLSQPLAQKPQKAAREDVPVLRGIAPAQVCPAELLEHLPPRPALRPGPPLHQLLEDHLGVPHQREGGLHVFPDFGGVHIDVDVGHPLLNLVRGDDGPVRHPGADHNEKVRLYQGLVGRIVPVGPDHAHVQRVLRRQEAEAHHRRDHRDAGILGKLPQLFLGVGQEHAAPGADHRPLGHADGRGHVGNLLVVAPDAGVIAPDADLLREDHVRHQLLLHVHGDVNEHRAGAARGGDVKRLLEDHRQLGRVLHQIAVLGKGGHRPGDVHLLEDIPPQEVGGHLARDGHQGDGVHIGRGHAGDEVRGPRAGGDDAHPRLPRHPGVAGGHVPGVLLRADQGVVQVGVLPQGVGNGADGGPGVAEDPLHALPGQALHQNLRACQFHAQHLLSVWKAKKPVSLVGPRTCKSSGFGGPAVTLFWENRLSRPCFAHDQTHYSVSAAKLPVPEPE